MPEDKPFIIAECKLTDGSLVFNVVGERDGFTTTFHCLNWKQALALETMLNDPCIHLEIEKAP